MNTTTELSAVNSMLATIGEAPVSTLLNSAVADVALARNALEEVVRSVLIDGWAFNTDAEYPLYPDPFSPFEISIPPNAMAVIPSVAFSSVTPRGNRLYDTATRSFSFEGSPPVICKVIWMADFADLPEVTRQYVTVRACRLFQARTAASEFIHKLTEREEMQAKWAHQRNNVRVNRKSLFMSNPNDR